MRIAVAREADPAEDRVAATPDTVKKLTSLGAEVAVEPGAGVKSGIPDSEFTAAGANVSSDAIKDADVVLKVRRPGAIDLASYKKGAVVIAIMDPYGNEPALQAMADAGITAFAMELLPRITRAQSMDVLSSSSQSRRLPRRDRRRRRIWARHADDDDGGRHRAGGEGVRHGRGRRRPAGDRDRAPARRHRHRYRRAPAVKEQVQSLGAKFIAVEDDEFKQAETAGGYAKEMSKEYQAKQATLVADHIKKQDIVITTALIPGRPAPRLVSKEMVASMRPGSVIVDLAVERGGNVEGVKPGEVASVDGVKIVGHLNVAGRLAATASALYAKNLLTFLDLMIDKASKSLVRAVGRRDREGDRAHPRRRRDPPKFCAEKRGVRSH